MDIDERLKNRQRFQSSTIIRSLEGDMALHRSHVSQEESSTSTHEFPNTSGDQREDACQGSYKDNASGSGLLLSEVTCTGLPAFPFRLHDMLNDAEPKGFDHVVSWQEGGRSFKVHDKDQFSKILLPRYFQGQTRYKSFQRQLNIYGFERILTGSNREKGGYTHSLLVRGKPMMCRLMIRTKVKNKGSRPSSSDSLARMRAMPTTTNLSTSSMQNSTFPIQQHNSAPDFGALLNNNNTILSMSNLVGSPSPRFSTTNPSYQNEQFPPVPKSNPDVDERLLMAVAAMCHNNETNPPVAHHRPSFEMRYKGSTSNSSTIQRKTIEAFNRLSRGGGGSGATIPTNLDVLRSAPVGIQSINYQKRDGEGIAPWGQTNYASLLGGQGGNGNGGHGIQQHAQSSAAVGLHDMDDSDMESIFNEDDYAIDPPEVPFICPDDSLASLSEWKGGMESSFVEADVVPSSGGPTSSCPVAADLVEVFQPR